MARKASQQVKMKIGRMRAQSLRGVTPPITKTQRLKTSVDYGVDGPVLVEGQYRFNLDYILGAIDLVREDDANIEEAVRLLLRDPRFVLSPIGKLADEIVRRAREQKIKEFIDAEVVEAEAIAIYVEKGEISPDKLLDMAGEYGEAALVAEAERPISDSEKSQYFIVMLKPSENALKAFESKNEQADDGGSDEDETVSSAGVSGYISNVGVNVPSMVSFGGRGSDKVSRPDDTRHLRVPYKDLFKGKPPKWTKDKKKKTQHFPLGINPNLGKSDD